MEGRARHWCFTLNLDGEDEDRNGLLLEPENWKHCEACVYQLEVGENGNPHFQGFVSFSSQKTFLSVQKLIPGAHFEVARNVRQAWDYCQKEDSRVEGPWIFGERPSGQGSRNDLEEIRSKIVAGAMLKDIADDHFETWCRYNKSFSEYKRLRTPKRDWAPVIYLVIGPTGTGKTKMVRDCTNGQSVYWQPNGGSWWSDYDGQPVVVLDEMNGARFKFMELLSLLDRYPHKVQTKGGYSEFVAQEIWITTNYEPEDWYDPIAIKQPLWELNPLRRRLDEFGTRIQTGPIRNGPVLALVNEHLLPRY